MLVARCECCSQHAGLCCQVFDKISSSVEVDESKGHIVCGGYAAKIEDCGVLSSGSESSKKAPHSDRPVAADNCSVHEVKSSVAASHGSSPVSSQSAVVEAGSSRKPGK